jgi:hypothetical protein
VSFLRFCAKFGGAEGRGKTSNAKPNGGVP